MYQALFEVRVAPVEPTRQSIPSQFLTQSEESEEFIFFAAVHVAGFCPCNARHYLNTAMEELPASEYSSRRTRLISFTRMEEGAETDAELRRTAIFSRFDRAVAQSHIEAEFVDIPRFPLKDRSYKDGVLTRWA
ncbi:hypothetical protein KSF_036600 [Reticulibacter mediterranei]|uniref:Uncharacterized protein n=1 Tax=Reticulibacter mediterranei TaxID=2778369 RepID=A0A8J3ILU3_9CHLR|nr:hypothetical protein [Reticulibacter mediterranei]GHO93612.1 hypothetical protein KSF_036600 [Reticulibacter mediterranei]